jgi:multimeric flavodoxin WrbA
LKRLLIVWHSRTGGAEQLARVAADGARAAGEDIDVVLRAAHDASAEDVLAASGYLFAAPENLGSLSGAMKDFFDRIYYPALDRIQGRPYAVMVCAGTDGRGAARQVQRICTGLRLREIAPPRIVLTGAQTPDAILAPKSIDAVDLQRSSELGAALACGVVAGIF